jgi:hypothetical protein
MTPPREQPPLFDVVMGDAVPTFHRDGRDQREAHAGAMSPDPWACACGFLNAPHQRACGSCRIRVRPGDDER